MLEKFSVNRRITEEFPPILSRAGIVTDGFMEDETFDLLGSVEDIDSFLNFSKDGIVDPAAAADFPPLADPLSVDDALLGATPGCVALVPPLGQEDASKLAAFDELDIAAADMDWVSHFLEDSVPYSVDFATITTGNNGSSGSSFRTSSPVSVLEPNSLACGGTSSTPSSSSSSSSCGFGGSSNTMNGNPFAPISSHPEAIVIPGRARTKRPRPASFSSRMQVTIPASERESCGEYDPPAMKKLKKEKKNPSVSAAGGEEAGPPPVRKCTHCEVTKTPQWRAGPRGPKTLCNACGVRYKSGRLFPEYRPAASPTFIPSCHSNSHKKVVEMRIKANQKDGMPLPDNPAIKGCDLLQFIRRRD